MEALIQVRNFESVWSSVLAVLELEFLLILSVVITLYGIWFIYTQIDNITIHSHKSNELHQAILASCPTLKEKYVPPFWVFNSHLQGGLGLVLRKNIQLPFVTEKVQTHDGGTLIMSFVYAQNASRDAPVLLIVPGVSGGSDKPYVNHLIGEAQKKNYHAVILIFPGCLIKEKEINLSTSPRFYSPVDISDVQIAIDFVHSKLPESPLIGVGHSMGAAMLTKYLVSEQAKNTKMKACISISNPWHIPETARNIREAFINKTVLFPHFHSYWIDVFKQNEEIFSKMISKEASSDILSSPTLRDFEERIAKHIYKRKDVETYYHDCSATNDLHNITIPYFVVHAVDDPVVPMTALPFNQFRKNENFFVCLTKTGGHSGWLEGHFNPSGLCFADRLAIEFIDTIASIEDNINMNNSKSESLNEMKKKSCI